MTADRPFVEEEVVPADQPREVIKALLAAATDALTEHEREMDARGPYWGAIPSEVADAMDALAAAVDHAEEFSPPPSPLYGLARPVPADSEQTPEAVGQSDPTAVLRCASCRGLFHGLISGRDGLDRCFPCSYPNDPNTFEPLPPAEQTLDLIESASLEELRVIAGALWHERRGWQARARRAEEGRGPVSPPAEQTPDGSDDEVRRAATEHAAAREGFPWLDQDRSYADFIAGARWQENRR